MLGAATGQSLATLPAVVALFWGCVSAAAVDVRFAPSWPTLLARHDLRWAWRCDASSLYQIRPRARELQQCGPAGCCLSSGPVALAGCSSDDSRQQWQLQPSGAVLNKASGRCLVNGSSGAALGPCAATQPWTQYDGFLTLGRATALGGGRGQSWCLAVNTSSPFCDETICPRGFARMFESGQPAVVAPCHNGDRSQLFGLYRLQAPELENLIPLTWAVAAYVGNGQLGMRVQAEQGSAGVFHLLLDNVMLGAGGHRQPSGYFRLDSRAGLPLSVTISQRLYTAQLEMNVTDPNTGLLLMSALMWVAADGPSVAVVELEWSGAAPVLEWIQTGDSPFASHNSTTGSSMTLLTTVAAKQGAQQTQIDAAVRMGVDPLRALHRAWWSRYWNEAFVSFPISRLEGLYYVEMYRFASSDRVNLHGLMGAFGPTGMFNLWPDDVWDMNEQVMYWLGAASNRPEITEPMMRFAEASGGVTAGGIWMMHNYVKQAQFEGDRARLTEHAWPALVDELKKELAGLKRLGDGKMHLVGCNSPEYNCYPPFQDRMCKPGQDCNFGLSQIRWGLQTVLALADKYGLNMTARGVDQSSWAKLLQSELAWYPNDHTGFRLDANCAFECPHRHFSHLLQVFDLETVEYDRTGNSSLNQLVKTSVDHWYSLSCNASNWFNEECRGFTSCALASMSTLIGRAEAAVGNLSALPLTPNGMYGEMVYMNNPGEFGPVSESAYCAAGVMHTMVLHTSPSSGVLDLFPGVPSEGWENVAFHKLRASGGLLVSAVRQAGVVEFVRLEAVAKDKSAAVAKIRVSGDSWQDLASPPKVANANLTVSELPFGAWQLALEHGQYAILYVSEAVPDLTVAPVAGNASEYNWFGYTRQMVPLH